MVNSLGNNKVFSVLAFEELLKARIELNEQQAEIIKQTKKELLESWKHI